MEGFFQNGKLYERLKNIFGFPIYSVKKCIFPDLQLKNSKKNNLNLKSLANHSNLEVSLLYAKDAVEKNMKIIKDYLRILNLEYAHCRDNV